MKKTNQKELFEAYEEGWLEGAKDMMSLLDEYGSLSSEYTKAYRKAIQLVFPKRKTKNSFAQRMKEEKEFPPEWAGGSGDE